MKSLFILCITLSFIAISSCSYADDSDWIKFKLMYSKSYSTQTEEEFRYSLFAERKNQISDMIAKSKGAAEFGWFKMMDMTQAEQRSQLGLFDKSQFESNTEEFDFIPNSNPQRTLTDDSFTRISAKYPDPPAKLSSFSHVKSFPAPKNQGGCGSCWAFAGTGIAESAYARGTGVVRSFSEADVLDCSGGGSCGGGAANTACDYIANNGFVLSSVYPYITQARKCTVHPRYMPSVTFKNIVYSSDVPEKIKMMKKYLYNVGPLQVNLAAGNSVFQSYKKGVLLASISQNCTSVDHAVIIVGFGYDANLNVEYWIIRNSWGSWWGESGYLRIEIGQNVCQMEGGSKWGLEYNKCFGKSTKESCESTSPMCKFCPTDNHCVPFSQSCPAATKNCTIDGPCCDPATKRYRPSYYTCRAAKSICDVAEYCTGIDSSCPADKVQEQGLVCRDAYVPTDGASSCDIAETCDGISAFCPSDSMKNSSTVCRAAVVSTNSKVLSCDVAEYCTGTSVQCPPDSFKDSSVVCRNKSSVACDIPEYCTSESAYCPVDVYLPVGAPCNDSNACTTDDQCNLDGACKGKYICSCSSNSVCNDLNPCTKDICDTKYKRCNYTTPDSFSTIACRKVSAATECDSVDYCTSNLVCGSDGRNQTCMNMKYPPNSVSPPSGSSSGVVVGVVLGVLCGIAVIVGAVFFLVKKRIIRRTSSGIGLRIVTRS
eukprot:TRINITY_DN2175_c0_g1_i1.p1 TRINITY_DN2175_c0_g1~~TRINITY_DN2175_c0_g1_i1.p1  ORF type:complete len:711 (-),score=176.73 TRINITY_DN2175_c0_g1_i1:38-2170(-)